MFSGVGSKEEEVSSNDGRFAGGTDGRLDAAFAASRGMQGRLSMTVRLS